MAQFVNMYKVDLQNGTAPVVSLRQIYYADSKANRVGAKVCLNGEPVSLAGTCTGTAILADGSTVPMEGVVSGNEVYVDLIPACYSVEGQIQVFVKLTLGDTETTLLSAVGTVRLTETDSVIDPGTIIPSVSQLITKIDDAIASIPPAADNLMAAIAPSYANLTFPVSADTYAWYNGALYSAVVDIPASETWTPSHWKAAVMGDELTDLKSAVSSLEYDASVAPKGILSDAQDVDLDVTDTNGNVLLRLQDGHVKTKNFDSSEVQEELDGKQDSLTFDNVPTENSNNPVKSAGIHDALQSIGAKVDALTIDVETAPKQAKTDAQDVDLDVTDTNGNVLARFNDGQIETKRFNSAYKLAVLRTSTEENTDFDLSDDSGNIILRLKNGELQTKKLDLINPYYLPDYYTDYLDTKCARIKALLSESGGDAFIFITDQHFTTGNTNHSFQLIYHIAKRCRINKLFCGGDMWDGVNELYANQFRNAIKDANSGRCYFVIGNHEMFSTTDNEVQYGLTALTDDEITDAEHIQRHYYYVDNPKNKVRYVILNGYSEGDTVPTREDGYEPDQMTWLHNVAMNVENGWQIVIITHEFYRVTNLYDSTLKVTSAIQTILNDIDSYNTNGEIVLMIQGHTHLDAIKQTTGGIPIMITCCDKYHPAGGEGGELWLNGRIPGTVTEQCFDVCVLDTVNRKLTAVRIGGFATDDPEQDEQLYEVGERVINY